MRVAGQICSATSRALIHQDLAPRVLARLKDRCAQVKACHPLTPERADRAYIGPIISAQQHAKVLAYIQGAQREGATLLCGGGRPVDAPSRGFYLAPTVLTNVEPHMTIWKEEVFGPVLVVKTFETEAQALELANDSSFGLAAAVLSKDEVRAQRVIRGVKAGICWVNCSQPCFCQAPWGGVRKSGMGRDNGELGMESFLEVKQVTRLRDQNLPPLASSAAPLVNCSYALLVSDAHGPGVQQVTTYKSKEPWGWYIPPGFTRPAPQQSKL